LSHCRYYDNVSAYFRDESKIYNGKFVSGDYGERRGLGLCPTGIKEHSPWSAGQGAKPTKAENF